MTIGKFLRKRHHKSDKLHAAERGVLTAAYKYVNATIECYNDQDDAHKVVAYNDAKQDLLMEVQRLSDVPEKEKSV